MTKNRRHDIVKPSKFKTSMCTFFMSEEGCPFGDKCAFAHGESELRTEPKESSSTTAASPTQPEATAATATSSPTSSQASERGNGSGAAEKSNDKLSNGKPAHQDSNIANGAANAKRKAKKTRMDASSSAAAVSSTHSIPGGRTEAAHARCRPQRERRTQPLLPPPPPPPPPPMHSAGPMPSAAYNLSVASPPPTAYALYGDLSMAYGGISAMPGMPYYIPTVGNHPFSNINNNHHAINVVPHMQNPMPYATTTATGPLPSTFSPALSQSVPTPQSSLPRSPMPLSESVGGANNTSVGEEAKRRPRQAMRHVVSSNTMAHTHGRHTTNAASVPPAEVASPQYVYGLMAAAGVPLNGSPMLAATTTTPASATLAPEMRKYGENPSAPPTPPQSHSQSPPQQPQQQQQQQPRLIVVPHKSGSGGFVVPSNIKNYYPQTTVEPTSPVLVNGTTGVRHTPASTATPQSVAGAGGGTSFQLLTTSPVPPTVVHIPLSSSSINSNHQPSNDVSSVSRKTIGDALWGPAGGSRDPLTTSALPIATGGDDVSGCDYNALLSGLGIGGSSYTTIPLEELVRQRGTTRDDDDVSISGDFDWTGALERWLHTAREENTTTPAATAATMTTTSSSAAAAVEEKSSPYSGGSITETATTVPSTAPTIKEAVGAIPNAAPYLPPTNQPVTSALNSTLVLMGGETKPKTTLTEGKRRPPVVCQVSRAGGKPAPPRRRAPVMTNQFKSSCVAEAGSGSVLLYCAEKNTLVYITTANAAGGGATAAAATQSSLAGSTLSNGESEGAATAHVCATSPESPNMASSNLDLGVDVRFNPGRKKYSVLVPEVSDDDAEYCI